MKNVKYTYSKILALTVLAVLTTIVSCERDLTDEVEFASFGNNPDVFIDGFSGGLEYLPFGGSVLNAFSVDEDTKYLGTSAMRFDVPNVGDPLGSFAGAIFPDNTGRDLSGYDALTFWAKGTIPGTINEIGFGTDFGENKYNTVVSNLLLTTNWRKYIIPIPDPSKLIQEKGMFWYAEGPENGLGYTFWIDELKYEKLGNIAQPRPRILNGQDVQQTAFVGAPITLTGLTQTFNLGSGLNQTVSAAPAYYSFESSDIEVARVSELGVVSVIGTGEAVITATLNGVRAEGSLTINVIGEFEFAPTPPARDAADVVSIFSDAYTNVDIEYFNGFFTPDGQTTLGGSDININGDNIINYTLLNFVAIKSLNTVNASAMTTMHVDFKVQDSQIDGGDFVRVLLLDAGPDGILGTGDETEAFVNVTAPTLVAGEWISLDVPLANFTGLNTSNLSLYFFISDGTVADILVDNLYFYR